MKSRGPKSRRSSTEKDQMNKFPACEVMRAPNKKYLIAGVGPVIVLFPKSTSSPVFPGGVEIESRKNMIRIQSVGLDL